MTFPRFDPEDLMDAAGRHVDASLAAVPQALLESGSDRTPLDIHVLVDPEAAWQVAHLALDAFGAQMSDRFGYSSLWAPMKFDGRVLLRLRTAVPSAAVVALIPPFGDAAERTIREVLGPEVTLSVAVQQPKEARDHNADE